MKPSTLVSVVGLGYVGLPLAFLADQKGYRVTGIDISKARVDLLRQRTMPFLDPPLERLLKKSNLEATCDFSQISKAEVIIICVPTPVYENHLPNLEPLKHAATNVGRYLQRGQLVILESTVNPGASEGVVVPILEEISKLKNGKDFGFAHCPERINPGDAKWTVRNIPRVVGGIDKESTERAANFYRSILNAEVRPMQSLREAEAVKIVENAFRDINIAFVNELAMSFSRLGIDVVNVIKGANTKPFAFLAHYPGCGVGGYCIPVDPYYLIEYAKEKEFDHDFLSLARRINKGMPRFTADLVFKGLNEAGIAIRDTKVAVLGLAYKAGIGDDRESPSYDIIRVLEEYGAFVTSFDPFVKKKSSAHTLNEAVQDAKAVVLTTPHSDFTKLQPEFFKNAGVRVLVDGKNCLSKEAFQKAGIVYKGIGT